jgi:hypothetical protein
MGTMRRHLRFVLAVLIGMAASLPAARAQQAETIIPPTYVGPANLYAPKLPEQEVPRPYQGPPNLYAPTAPEEDLMEQLGLHPTGPDRKRFHPISNAIHQHPCYCVGHHNSLGCGSLKADCVFIFGSCRLFYGEPCFKGPNPYPPHHMLLHKGKGEGPGCASCGP